MERTEAASSRDSRASATALVSKPAIQTSWPFSGRMTMIAAGIAIMVAIGAVAVGHRPSALGHTTSSPVASAPATPAHPAYTRAEEAYIQALWPVHGEVERSTTRVSLGVIFYKINEIDKPDLKARLDVALATYQQAESRLTALQPPPSLAHAHHEYLASIRLFQQSVLEAEKMFDDGNDSHLVTAYPMKQEGTNRIREIGGHFWQDEFPPN